MSGGRILIIRLSSMGDVVMATSALTVLHNQGRKADWVVAREFAELLRGHPAVGQVWEFDRKSGSKGWVELCRSLHRAGYDEVWDLHLTQRSFLLKSLFRVWGFSGGRFRSISKQRVRFYGYCLFKALWPKVLRPVPFVVRFAQLAGGTGQELPNLSHLAQDPNREVAPVQRPSDYVCVMPGSKWKGKIWQAQRYFEVLRRSRAYPVVMGTHTDQASHELVALLKTAGISHQNGIGQWGLARSAQVLAGARAYLGNDTGLAHLAEAMGTPAVVVLGPTTEDLGYGPNFDQSESVGSSLWCRPCGKNGQNCHRVFRRRLCLKGLEAQVVLDVLERVMAAEQTDGMR